MLERDSTGLLTLFGGNECRGGCPYKLQVARQHCGPLHKILCTSERQGDEWTKERCSSTGDGNWKKHSSVFLIADSRGKAFLPGLEERGNESSSLLWNQSNTCVAISKRISVKSNTKYIFYLPRK